MEIERSRGWRVALSWIQTPPYSFVRVADVRKLLIHNKFFIVQLSIQFGVEYINVYVPSVLLYSRTFSLNNANCTSLRYCMSYLICNGQLQRSCLLLFLFSVSTSYLTVSSVPPTPLVICLRSTLFTHPREISHHRHLTAIKDCRVHLHWLTLAVYDEATRSLPPPFFFCLCLYSLNRTDMAEAATTTYIDLIRSGQYQSALDVMVAHPIHQPLHPLTILSSTNMNLRYNDDVEFVGRPLFEWRSNHVTVFPNYIYATRPRQRLQLLQLGHLFYWYLYQIGYSMGGVLVK